jgi:hypothetical protein
VVTAGKGIAYDEDRRHFRLQETRPDAPGSGRSALDRSRTVQRGDWRQPAYQSAHRKEKFGACLQQARREDPARCSSPSREPGFYSSADSLRKIAARSPTWTRFHSCTEHIPIQRCTQFQSLVREIRYRSNTPEGVLRAVLRAPRMLVPIE